MIEAKIYINNQIRAKDLRVILGDGSTLGVLTLEEALRVAKEKNLDLIEISPNAKPPIAKMMDYGRFQYEQKKKKGEAKAKAHLTETKNIQVKVGTGPHDLELKAKKASAWLKEGHRIQLDLYLVGRAKYMEMSFKKERLERILKLITENYKITTPATNGPKGIIMVLEPVKK